VARGGLVPLWPVAPNSKIPNSTLKKYGTENKIEYYENGNIESITEYENNH
jgi:hypothetical protein